MQVSSYSEYLKSAGKARRLDAAHAAEILIVSGVMHAVLNDAAASLKPDANVSLTSVTLDVLRQGNADQAVTFETRLDRQTRTLIFISALAKQGESAVLKATAIYRIS